MGRAQTHKLKIHDTELAQFSFEKSMAGFRARHLEIEQSTAHLLPLNILLAPNDAELGRFLASRRIPKGRVFLEEILRPYGLSPKRASMLVR